MRLLHTNYDHNTDSVKISEHHDPDIPEYAILTHRWYRDPGSEVSFQEIHKSESKALKGYEKILRCCTVAKQRYGCEYVWIDTCCIDKASSAELSEAINSMFKWYQKAKVCIAYLDDVSPSNSDRNPEFSESKWFKRGWTLQELLAPEKVEFYDCGWKRIGSKQENQSEISSITGIAFEHLDLPNIASVAQKMSWASKRETTKPEDMSYCLLGLFNINMVPIYGEGSKAFMRLQREIAMQEDDESLFAWNDSSAGLGNQGFSGMFADSPFAFEKSGNIVRKSFESAYRPPWTVTNRGLGISLYLNKALDAQIGGSSQVSRLVSIPLNCARERSISTPLCIRLVRLSRDELARSGLGEIPFDLYQLIEGWTTTQGADNSLVESNSLELRQVYIREYLAHERIDSHELLPRGNIRTFLFPMKSHNTGFQVMDYWCSYPSLALFNPRTWTLTLGEGYAGLVFSQFKSRRMERFLLIIRLGWHKASLDVVLVGRKGIPSRHQKIVQIYGDPDAWPNTSVQQFKGLLQRNRELSVTLRQGDGPGEQHCYVDMRVNKRRSLLRV